MAKRVALLAPQLHSAHPAGGEMLKIVQSLASDFEFTVFGRSLSNCVEADVRFERVLYPDVRPRLISHLLRFLSYGLVFKLARLQEEFDLVHAVEATTPYAHLVSMHACVAHELSLIQNGTFEMDGIRDPYYRVFYSLVSATAKYTLSNPYIRHVTCVSENLKQNIVKFYRPKIEPSVIPNSVDYDRFADAGENRVRIRSQLGLNPEEPVGAIAALGKWEHKGLGIICDALSLLSETPVKILVIGPGTDSYRNLCKMRGLGNRLIFVGFVEDLASLYGAADFFVLPSISETWSIVSREAAASGLPLIVTRVGGLQEIVEHGVTGYFVDRSPKSIANTILRAIQDLEKLHQMGLEAQRRSRDFHAESAVHKYRNLYRALIC